MSENQIFRKEALFAFSFRVFSLIVIIFLSTNIHAQQIQVVDENEEGLEAVWIFNKQTGSSLFTDDNGLATLENTSPNDTLIFEHLGYQSLSKSYQEILALEGLLKMEAESTLLSEVTVVGRSDQRSNDLISETAIISSKNIQLTNPQTTVDALAGLGELFVQKSQMGGGSPVMRGFEANRILLVVDGIRLNNAIYRNGHLQNAITVDPQMLSKMELIFGPASLSYGSDALGGVIHFRTRQARFNVHSDKNFSQQFSYKLRASSANREKSGHLSWNAGWNNVAILSGISYSDYENLRAGNRRPSAYPDFGKRLDYVERINGQDQILVNDDPNVQIGTAYDQLDIFQKMRIRFSEELIFSTNVQYSTSSDIPRYDALGERTNDGYKYAEWYYGPQTRFLASARVDMQSSNLFFDRLIAIAAQQNIQEDRHSRNFDFPILESTLEDIRVRSFTLDLDKKLNSHHSLVYGMDIQDNQLNSEGRGENITSGEITGNVFSRYPDNYASLLNFGAYIHYTWERNWFEWQSGIRWNQNTMKIAWQEDAPIQWPDYFYSGIDSRSEALAYSLGFRVKTKNKGIYKINLSSAFRSPNIDDLAKVRVKNGEMLVPNPELTAETAYNAEISIQQKGQVNESQYRVLGGAYITLLYNGIVREDFQLPNGQRRYFDGIDSLDIVANVNADQVLIYGAFLSMDGQLGKGLSYGGRINATYGRILEENVSSPAGHIPPLFGTAWLNYEFDRLNIRFSALFNGEKAIEDYGGSVDNPEYATPDGSYEWTIFNLHTSYRISDLFTINAGVENILDKHYRPFASGVSAPGLNVILGLSGRF